MVRVGAGHLPTPCQHSPITWATRASLPGVLPWAHRPRWGESPEGSKGPKAPSSDPDLLFRVLPRLDLQGRPAARGVSTSPEPSLPRGITEGGICCLHLLQVGRQTSRCGRSSRPQRRLPFHRRGC